MYKCSLIVFFVLLFIFASCSDNSVQQNEHTLVYEKTGLVDSVVVTQCVLLIGRYFTDTLNLDSYDKIKVEFDGLTNSDGSFVKVYAYTEPYNVNEIYSVENQMNINGMKSVELNKPDNKVLFEIRLYVNPPVCGQGEYKFTRVRDLKIYGIK